MKIQMRQRDRRALILLALGLLIYGVAEMAIIPAYDRLTASSEMAADKESQLRRYRRAELRKGQYTGLLKVAGELIAKSESAVIPAPNLSLASAELQSLVEGAGSKAGIMLSQRTLGMPRRANEFYAELPMTLSFDSTPGQLVSFLNELRTIPRFFTVRSMDLTPVEAVMEAPKGRSLTKNLHVNMTVSSLITATILKPETGPR